MEFETLTACMSILSDTSADLKLPERHQPTGPESEQARKHWPEIRERVSRSLQNLPTPGYRVIDPVDSSRLPPPFALPK